MRIQHVTCSAILLAVCLGAFGVQPANSAEPTPPNIVFIFADDLGYGDLACYGHPYAKTPAIDRLAREGTRFTQFYVAGITCCPSRTGIMTGLFPARFPKYMADYGFRGRVTVTDLLKQRGYRTGHFGKWHMGPDTDGVYGIDEYAAGERTKGTPRGRDAGLFDSAIDFIKRHANRDKPFYVNIWGHITHYPVAPHRSLAAKFKHVKVDRNDFSKTMQHKFDECLQLGGDLDRCMQRYLGDVYALDMQVERVLKTIDDLGIRDNTIVVFSSDHGPAPIKLGKDKHAKEFSRNMLGYAGQFRGGKHSQYEGGVRSPFLIRWPGRVKAGHVDNANVISGIDWLPTLCSIAGVKDLPKRLDGDDVSDIWLGATRPRIKPLLWRTSSPNASPAIRDGKWKLHLGKRRGQTVELYDLSNDPSESNNVASRHADVVARLTKKLNAWVAQLPKAYDKADNKADRKKARKERRQ